MIYYCQSKLGGLYLHCCLAFVAQPFIFGRSISCCCTVCRKMKTKVMQESIVSYHFPVDMKSIFLCIMNTDKCLYTYCFISFHMLIYKCKMCSLWKVYKMCKPFLQHTSSNSKCVLMEINEMLMRLVFPYISFYVYS